MLREYKQYLQRLQNNLIQCGVQIQPTMSVPVSYREIFEECNRLEQIFWFFSMAEISGAEYALVDYPTVLSGHFKERFRARVYSQYEDVLENYKKISTTAILLNGSTYTSNGSTDENEVDLFGAESEDVEDYWKSEEVQVEDNQVQSYEPEYEEQEIEDNQVQVYEPEYEEHPVSPKSFLDMVSNRSIKSYSSVPHGVLIDLIQQEKYNSVPHGVFIDLIEGIAEVKETKCVSHGVYIDRICSNIVKNTCENRESVVYSTCSHGIYIDLIQVGDGLDSESFDEEGFTEEISLDEEYDEGISEEISLDEEFEEAESESIDLDAEAEEYGYEEESGLDDDEWEEESESIDLDAEAEEEEYGYDEEMEESESIDLDAEAEEYGYEEESGLDDDEWEEESESIDLDAEAEEYEEESGLDDYDEEMEESESIDLDAEMEDEESGLDDYDEEGESESTDLDAEMEEESGLDDDSWDEEGESESIDLDAEMEDEEQPQSKPKQQTPKPKQKPENRDLSDYLQDGTNQVLTGIKRQVKRVTGKFNRV